MGLFLWLETVRRRPVRSPVAQVVLAFPCVDQVISSWTDSYGVAFELLFDKKTEWEYSRC